MNDSDSMRSLYQDVLLDHHQDPRNFCEIEKPDITQEGYNPLCGDRVCLQVKLGADHETLERVCFKGEGCAICMASSSMMTEDVQGKKKSEILERIQHFRDWMQGNELQEFEEGDIHALVGVRNFPVRIKCALLPWTTLKEAIGGKL